MNPAKTTFICDSPLIAFIVSLIAPSTTPIDVVIEIKETIDSADSLIQSIKLILSGHIVNFTICRVPSPFFISDYTKPVKTIRNLRQFKIKVLLSFTYDKKRTYAGPNTSSLFLCTPFHRRIYLDHGWRESYYRCIESRSFSIARVLIHLLRYLLYKPLRLPAPSISVKFLHKGYTLCKVIGDWFIHLDYQKYILPAQLQKCLSNLNSYRVDSRHKALVLMSSPWLNSQCLPLNNSSFDDANIVLATSHCNKNEIIFIKYHRQLFLENTDVASTVAQKLHLDGFTVIDVDRYLPVPLRGHIPAEILISFLKIERLIGESSATHVNIALRSVVKIVLDKIPFLHLRSTEEQLANSTLDEVVKYLCRD